MTHLNLDVSFDAIASESDATVGAKGLPELRASCCREPTIDGFTPIDGGADSCQPDLPCEET